VPGGPSGLDSRHPNALREGKLAAPARQLMPQADENQCEPRRDEREQHEERAVLTTSQQSTHSRRRYGEKRR
jgi:hypothetical protein